MRRLLHAPFILVAAGLALGACRSEAPAPAASEVPPAAPAPTVPAQPPLAATAPPPAEPAPLPAPGAERKALLTVLHQELVCATHADEAADLLPILQARGYETLSDYARDMDRYGAEDPDWARNAVEQADPARCK